MTDPITAIEISAQAIVANRPREGIIQGTLEDCEKATDDPKGVVVHFIVIADSGDSQNEAVWETTYDLLGPPAPSDVSAGSGEERLLLDWSVPQAEDIAGFRFFCDPPPGSTSPSSGGGGSGGTTGGSGGTSGSGGTTGGSGGTSGSGGLTGATGGGSSLGGAAGSGGEGTTGGSGGPVPSNPNCPSNALVAGERPDEAFACGQVNSGLSGDGAATGLINGVQYAVGVAAFDQVENIGPLSRLACGTPEEVDDFFELYRRSGGEGGGGFCRIGPSSGPWMPAGLSAAVLALVVRRWPLRRQLRRRRRSSKARAHR